MRQLDTHGMVCVKPMEAMRNCEDKLLTLQLLAGSKKNARGGAPT